MGVWWSGDVIVGAGEVLGDLQIIQPTVDDDPLPSITTSTLHLLATVDPNRIPLHLICGPSHNVQTTNETTLRWMQQLFADGFPKVHASSDDVYGQLRPPDNENDFPIQSAVGILLKVEDAHSTVEPSEFLRITELLIYAIKSAAGSVVFDESQTAESQSSSNKNDERTAFFALPLSSDLLYIPPVPKSLPDEPEKVQSGGPLSASSGGRDRLSTLFDEASDRRKKARRKGGQSIGLAASRGAAAPRLSNPAIKVEEDDSAVITAKFTKATSLASDVVSQSSRPASRRSMSIAPAAPRPSSAGVNEVADAYTAETSTDPDVFIDTSFEARNKAAISRTVMACMRMHGFQQQKRRSTTAADTKIEDHDDEMGDLPGDAVTEDAEIRAAKDAEFKALYHQAYKGAAFAFRNVLNGELLKPDAIRDVVDRLLAVFCIEPP